MNPAEIRDEIWRQQRWVDELRKRVDHNGQVTEQDREAAAIAAGIRKPPHPPSPEPVPPPPGPGDGGPPSHVPSAPELLDAAIVAAQGLGAWDEVNRLNAQKLDQAAAALRAREMGA